MLTTQSLSCLHNERLVPQLMSGMGCSIQQLVSWQGQELGEVV